MTGSASESNVDYAGFVSKTTNIIDSLESLVKDYVRIIGIKESKLFATIPELEGEPFRRERAQISRQMISIAFCGMFTSGKSFLISGLLGSGRLKWYQPKSAEFMLMSGHSDEYAPFLPSSPEQTSSCPLMIVPSPDDRSYLEILFKDTGTWEDRSEPYSSENDIQQRMLVYVTEIEENRRARPERDLGREVINAKLHLSNMPLPAVVYDLPGIGGEDNAYQEVVQNALMDADCIVYVATALRELSEAELDFLRLVSEIAQDRKSPVFFVLSQIDREKEWKKVQKKDNDFLNKHFKASQEAGRHLLSRGFFPVSPALKAKAEGLLAEGKLNEDDYESAVNFSGMPRLLELLESHLRLVSGPTKLRDIVLRLNSLLKSLRFKVTSDLQAEEIPIENAKKAIAEKQARNRRYLESQGKLMEDLETRAKHTLLAAFSTSDADDLARQLRTALEPLIRDKNVLKASVRHEIMTTRRDVETKWLRRPGGLKESWNDAWANYQKQTIMLLRDWLEDAAEHAPLSNVDILDTPDGRPPIPIDIEEDTISVDSAVGLFAKAWQAWVGVTGVGAGGIAGAMAAGGGLGGLATLTGLAAAAAPLGVFVASFGAAGLSINLWKKSKKRSELSDKLVYGLPDYSSNLLEYYEQQAKQALAAHQGEIVKVVNQLIAAEQSQIQELEHRLTTGELQDNRRRLAELTEIQDKASKIEKQIQRFFRDISKISEVSS